MKAMDKTVAAGKGIKQSADDGTLKDKTSEAAAKAGAFLGGGAQYLYNLTKDPN